MGYSNNEAQMLIELQGGDMSPNLIDMNLGINEYNKFVNNINEKILKEITKITNINLIILNYDKVCKIKIIDNDTSNKYIVIYSNQLSK